MASDWPNIRGWVSYLVHEKPSAIYATDVYDERSTELTMREGEQHTLKVNLTHRPPYHSSIYSLIMSPTQLLAQCVPFDVGTIEAAGSFPLNMYQRIHESRLDYPLEAWHYNDIDVFVTAPKMYDEIIHRFEDSLKAHNYTILRRTVKRFTKSSGITSVDRITSHGDTGDVRLTDYSIAGIPYDISLINSAMFVSVADVTSRFDISACAISCTVRFDSGSVDFQFGWGDMSGFSPSRDIMSGVAHFQFAQYNQKRTQKYLLRGFTSIEPLNIHSGEIGDCFFSAASEGGSETTSRDEFERVYCEQSGASEVEHHNISPMMNNHVVAHDITHSILSLNCNYRLKGSNATEVIDLVLETNATYVCLQEVTRQMISYFESSVELCAANYSVYTAMNFDGSVYGLAMITKSLAVDYKSLPLPSTQSRRLDVAVFEHFAIANIHAESLKEGDATRVKQTEIVINMLSEEMDARSIDGFLVGDLNTMVGSSNNLVLAEYFDDTNKDATANTYQVQSQAARHMIRYYDRILQLKTGRPPLAVLGWSVLDGRGGSDHHPVIAHLDM